ncbi:MAG: methyltransferase domain-containing protein [Halioglobus sp.]
MSETFDLSGYSKAYPAGIEYHFWHIARNDLIYRWLRPRLKKGDLIMDVGCGTGIVVNDLRSRGLTVNGVELGPAPVMSGLDADIRTETSLFDLDVALKNDIGIVLLLDVLEHMRERRNFLQRIYRELPNCHTVLVTVPARMEIWSEYDRYWGHHLRFDRPGLASDLMAAGYRPDRNAYFFNWVYLSSLLFKLLKIDKSNEFKAIKRGSFKAFCHRVIGFFTSLESRLVPGAIAGSSIICVASRSENSANSSRR